MKLSEAMRLGEFAAEPAYGSWFRRQYGGKVCGACAVGRCLMAAGYVPRLYTSWYVARRGEMPIMCRGYDPNEETEELSTLIQQKWPWTKNHQFSTAVFGGFKNFLGPGAFNGATTPIMADISNLYECGEMTIQQIADWLETVEPHDDPTPQPKDTQDVTLQPLLTPGL